MFSKMRRIPIEAYTGFKIQSYANIPTLKASDFVITDITKMSVMGDAPKELIKVYEPSRCTRNKKTWIRYIAKTGEKVYPSESITEYFLNCVGKFMGFKMSNSKLAMSNGQIGRAHV